MARPGGLGRGLGALIPTGVVVEQARSGCRTFRSPSIRPNPQQPREHFDEEALAALAESIREVGVLQPVLVRAGEGDGYELIAGERRWRAARRIGLQTIPAIVRVADDASMLQQAIVENIQREELNPLEEAAAYQQLIEDFSLTHDDVATRVGKSRDDDHEHPAAAPAPAVDPAAASRSGTLRMGHARALLGTPDRAFQEQLAKRAVAEDLSVREVEEAIRHRDGAPSRRRRGRGRRGPGGKLRPPGLLELEELLGDYLETRVKITMGARHGRVADRVREPRGPRADLPGDEPGPDRSRARGVSAQAGSSMSVGSSTPRRTPSTNARRRSRGSARREHRPRRPARRADELAHDRGHPRLAQEAVRAARRARRRRRARVRSGSVMPQREDGRPRSGRSGWRSRRSGRRARRCWSSATKTSAPNWFACAASTLVVVARGVEDRRRRRGCAARVRRALRRGRPPGVGDEEDAQRRRGGAGVRRSVVALAHAGDRAGGERRSRASSAARVAGPQTPSAVEPALRWNWRSAVFGLGPEDAVLAAGVETRARSAGAGARRRRRRGTSAPER